MAVSSFGFLFILFYFLIHATVSSNSESLLSQIPGESKVVKRSSLQFQDEDPRFSIGFTLETSGRIVLTRNVRSAFQTFLSSLIDTGKYQVTVSKLFYVNPVGTIRLYAQVKDPHSTNQWLPPDILRGMIKKKFNNDEPFVFSVDGSLVFGRMDSSAALSNFYQSETLISRPRRAVVNTCLHNGTCSPANNITCQCICPFGYDGPNCQQMKLTLLNSTSVVITKSIPSATGFHLTFNYITSQYNGRGFLATVTNAANDTSMTVYLSGGYPSIYMKGSTWTKAARINSVTNKNILKRIDVITQGTNVIFMMDLCKAMTSSLCLSVTNVTVALNFTGGRLVLGKPLTAISGLTTITQALSGCASNVRLNGNVQDLYQATHTSNPYGCSGELDSCGYSTSTYGFCGQYGLCNGALTGTQDYRCTCKPGHRHLDENLVTGKSACNATVSSHFFGINSSAKFSLPILPETQRQTKSSQFQVMFRTRQTNSLIYSLENSASSSVYMRVMIKNSQPSVILSTNTATYGIVNATLSNVNVSDGAWHTIRIIRVIWMLEVVVDDTHYLFKYSTPTSTATAGIIYNQNNTRIVGKNAAVDATLDFQGCMKDVTMFNNWRWMPFTNAATASLDYVTSIATTNVAQNNCTNTTVCTASTTCRADQNLSTSAWGICNCNCAANYYDINNTCIVGICVIAPCQNGGTCTVISQALRNRTCICTASYTGVNCTIAVVTPTTVPLATAGFAWYFILLIVLALILLLLILILCYCCCWRKRALNDDLREVLEEFDSVPEKMGDDCTDGAGEEDFGGYIDFRLLQKPIAPVTSDLMKPLGNDPPNNPKSWQNPSFDNDEHIDHPLEYGYEGQGSYVSLSSLASGSTDDDLDFDHLPNWGPRFNALSDLYRKPDE